MVEHRRHALSIAVVASIALFVGWSTFWFMTDDAFIAFRYISNSMAGHGWVWNAAPFRPVDGYTSLGWIALLEAIWRVTGIDPPRSANLVALVFAYGQLAICLRMLWRVRLPETLERARPWLVALAVTGVLTNRTFLAWTSSGLETSMFDFAILLWVYIAVWRRNTIRRWAIELVTVGMLAALTRPDGMLYLCSGVAIVGLELAPTPRAQRVTLVLAATGGVIGLATYLVWHHASYGAWFPNTFYAKVARRWPAAGTRWLLSFVLEYALWWWIGAMALVARVVVRERWRLRPWSRPAFASSCRAFAGAVPALTIVAHVGYYTLIVGGDHFEYRVLTPLVPLVFVTMVWATGRLMLAPGRARLLLSVFVVSSWILPWTHWFATRDLDTRDASAMLRHAVAPHLPPPLSWYAAPFDKLQKWLIEHYVCVRHQEHKIFYEHKISTLPSREIGAHIGTEITADGIPTHAAGEAGYVGWVLPNVAIIDAFGLNDYYVARNTENTSMRMAHSRTPPAGYLEAFVPNVEVEGDQWVVKPRKRAIGADEIIAIERRYDVWLANLR